jgi:aarF domain-containing kinase
MRTHLLNKCPVSQWSEVRGIIQEDLGATPEQLFSSFDPTPIASASLAQVGPARDDVEEEVCVWMCDYKGSV